MHRCQDALGHLDGIESAVLAQDFDWASVRRSISALISGTRSSREPVLHGDLYPAALAAREALRWTT
jgi:hypothetical protein